MKQAEAETLLQAESDLLLSNPVLLRDPTDNSGKRAKPQDRQRAEYVVDKCTHQPPPDRPVSMKRQKKQQRPNRKALVNMTENFLQVVHQNDVISKMRTPGTPS